MAGVGGRFKNKVAPRRQVSLLYPVEPYSTAVFPVGPR